MSINDSDFPSSQAFELIRLGLEADPSLKKKFTKDVGAVVVFVLKNRAGKEQAYTLEFKKDGYIKKGPYDGKADITLSVSDDDFQKLYEGKANAQKLFLGGKLKVKGNIMKAASIEGVLNAAKKQAKL